MKYIIFAETYLTTPTSRIVIFNRPGNDRYSIFRNNSRFPTEFIKELQFLIW